MTDSKRKGKRIFALLVCSMSTIFSLALLELVIRMLQIVPSYDYPDGMYQDDAFLGYKLAPNFTGSLIKPEFSTPFHTNSLGLNERELGPKRSTSYRILALGDSFTWGCYGVPLDQTFVKMLERKLNSNRAAVEFEVVNTGVPGYGPREEFLYLKHYGISLSPDMVILNFFIENDFDDNVTKHTMRANEQGQLVQQRHKNVRKFLLQRSHTYRILDKIITQLPGDLILNKKVVKEWVGRRKVFAQSFQESDQVKTTLQFLENVKELTQNENVDFMVVVIPTNYQVDDGLMKLFMQEAGVDANEINFSQPQQILRDWGKANGVEVLDLLPILQQHNTHNDFYWKINAHFNARGHAMVADILYNKLIKHEKFIKHL